MYSFATRVQYVTHVLTLIFE